MDKLTSNINPATNDCHNIQNFHDDSSTKHCFCKLLLPHFLSKGMDQQQADDKHSTQVTPWIENAADFDPPDRRTTDMSPKGLIASTSRAMPTERGPAVSIRASTTSPDAMSLTPFRRSHARVSASAAGSLRPNEFRHSLRGKEVEASDDEDRHGHKNSEGKQN